MATSLSPLDAPQIIDEYFIENRNRLLEIAAFLDRLDRAAPGDRVRDFRMAAFHDALLALTSSGPSRLHRIQLIFSDPTTDPRPALDRKGAVGAFDPGSGGRA